MSCARSRLQVIEVAARRRPRRVRRLRRRHRARRLVPPGDRHCWWSRASRGGRAGEAAGGAAPAAPAPAPPARPRAPASDRRRGGFGRGSGCRRKSSCGGRGDRAAAPAPTAARAGCSGRRAAGSAGGGGAACAAPAPPPAHRLRPAGVRRRLFEQLSGWRPGPPSMVAPRPRRHVRRPATVRSSFLMPVRSILEADVAVRLGDHSLRLVAARREVDAAFHVGVARIDPRASEHGDVLCRVPRHRRRALVGVGGVDDDRVASLSTSDMGSV